MSIFTRRSSKKGVNQVCDPSTMSSRYQGRNFDPNYTKRGRGRGRGRSQRGSLYGQTGSDVFGQNPGRGSATSMPANSEAAKRVSDVPVESTSAQSRKGGRRPRRKSNPHTKKKTKLGKPTKLALDVKTTDYKRARTNYFSPPFGPLQEVYHYLKPRMTQYFNDYCRSLASKKINYNYEFFYQSFAFRVSELYLSKVWLYASPHRFISGHYDQIKAILNSTQPLIKEMIQDVSQFVGDFELHDKLWTNKFPLLTVSHHWLQAAYGYVSKPPYKHLNQRKGLISKRMSHLPLVITPVYEIWPIPNELCDEYAEEDEQEGWDLLVSSTRALDVKKSIYLQNWFDPNADEDDEADALVDLNKVTIYYFNGMIDPTPNIHDWIEIPTGADNTVFDYHIGEKNPDEVHPTLKQQPSKELQRPCLTRFFPWRTTHRTEQGFIIQFNCEFLQDSYNEILAREGVENISMPLASVLLQLIGCEIDCFLDYWDARFVFEVGSAFPEFGFRKSFAVREPNYWNHAFVNLLASGVVKIEYEDESGDIVREKLPMHLRYKLPLWWHAYTDFEELNEMNGFLNPNTGFEEKNENEEEPQQRDQLKYDIERHWWKWVMAGIYPRWCHYRHISMHLESHWSSACASVQLDFLKNEVPVEHYRMPDSSGSSALFSRIFKVGQSENLMHVTTLNPGELVNAFILTDRANWIHPSKFGPWNRDFVYVSHFEGLDQVRRIKDIISSFFPQSAWTIKNE